MEFSHEYFDDEVREDFYVSGLMKRLWAANLEVISDVAKVYPNCSLQPLHVDGTGGRRYVDAGKPE